jgi:hypothetical protein
MPGLTAWTTIRPLANYRDTLDPTHMPHVIRVDSPVAMRWDRWASWAACDERERWRFDILDTDALTREQAAKRVVAWPENSPMTLR